MYRNFFNGVSFCLTLTVLLAGCSRPEDAATGALLPSPVVARLDEDRYLGEPVHVENLTAWPVVAEKYLEVGKFLTLDEAQERKLAVVREMGSGQQSTLRQSTRPSTRSTRQSTRRPTVQTSQQITEPLEFVPIEELADPSSSTIQEIAFNLGAAATVNQVVIENKSDLPILVCAGTIIEGGKQDRQIGQDIVLGPGSSVPVDAFCVEKGRWTGVRMGQQTYGMFSSKSVLAPKEVRYTAQYGKDQSAVWNAVSVENARADKSPATHTLLDTINETDEEKVALRERVAKKIEEHFQALRHRGAATVGFAYAINGKPMGVRVFAHPQLLESQLKIFAKTLALETDLAQRKAPKVPVPQASADDIIRMVNAVNEEEEKVSKTSAANFNGVRQGAAGGNATCYAEIFLPSQSAEAQTERTKRRVAITQDWTAPERK